MAVIDISFREPGATELTNQTVIVNDPFAPDTAPVAGYFDASDPAVLHKSFAMLNLYRRRASR